MPKIGLEIHQRLRGKKLFCQCEPKEAETEATVTRELHLSKSETGEVDIAAKKEIEKQLLYVYHYSAKNACLVELDEEPPNQLNREALKAAIDIAATFNMTILPYVRFMRKIVVDGSNTSGFQRTALVAIDGYLETSFGRVGIQTLCLEEESAGILGQKEGIKEYDLSRLGIPLIEIATKPEMNNGKQTREVAEKIGLTLRMSPAVARGIGTIRQDLNISVEGGTRVEIKGAQELEMLEEWVENEIRRQRKLLEIIAELKKRGAYPLAFKARDITAVLKRMPLRGFVAKLLSSGKKAIALPLPGHEGILGKEIGPQRRYGSELADYARATGCGGLLHSDEQLEKYGIDKAVLERELGKAYAIIIDEEKKAWKGIRAVYERAKMDFIPAETRKALPNGSTQYMRPLPGGARMYPETDVPLVHVTLKPEKLPTAEEKLAWLKTMLNDDLARKMLRSHRLWLFEEMVKKGHEPKLLATTLEVTWNELRREGLELKEEYVIKALEFYKKGLLTKKGVKEFIRCLASGKEEQQCLEKWKKIPTSEVKKLLQTLEPAEIMKKFGARVDPKDVFGMR